MVEPSIIFFWPGSRIRRITSHTQPCWEILRENNWPDAIVPGREKLAEVCSPCSTRTISFSA